MTKGQQTRHAIIEEAANAASLLGLNGVTIGTLADRLQMSKSGLHAHVGSKEALQLDVLEYTAQVYVDEVLKPALAEPRGEPRMRALFDRWMAWYEGNTFPGGCPFFAVVSEFDDRPGPVRDLLAQMQRNWMDSIARIFQTGIDQNHFSDGVDPEQFAHDLQGILLAYTVADRLLDDPAAGDRARRAFEALLDGVRTENEGGA